MRKALVLLVAVLVVSASLGCTSTAQFSDEPIALDTVGDFMPLHQHRVVIGDVSFVLPVGWRVVNSGPSGIVVRSQDRRGAVVCSGVRS